MRDRSEQARAYLREAETTLRSARVLFEDDADAFAPNVVKNAYDAFEQALSAGIAGRGEGVPRRHGEKIRLYFAPLDATELEQVAFDWHSRRSKAQYVDFEGADLSVPSESFDRTDAERILDDAERLLQFVRQRLDDET